VVIKIFYILISYQSIKLRNTSTQNSRRACHNKFQNRSTFSTKSCNSSPTRRNSACSSFLESSIIILFRTIYPVQACFLRLMLKNRIVYISTRVAKSCIASLARSSRMWNASVTISWFQTVGKNGNPWNPKIKSMSRRRVWISSLSSAELFTFHMTNYW